MSSFIQIALAFNKIIQDIVIPNQNEKKQLLSGMYNYVLASNTYATASLKFIY